MLRGNRIWLAIAALFLFQSALIAFLVIFPTIRPAPPQATPIPILPAATLPPERILAEEKTITSGECEVRALGVIDAWIIAGKPQDEPFEFESLNGEVCSATFADIFPLFDEPNIWYGGSNACSSCHGPDVEQAAGRLSLASYDDIVAGSRRESADQTGVDILGDETSYEKSLMHVMIVTKAMPIGRPPDSHPEGPVISVGQVNE